jgi:hypothetical protein
MKHTQNHRTSTSHLLSQRRSLPTVHSCHRSRPRSRNAQMIAAAAAMAIAGAAPVKGQAILHVLNNSDNDSDHGSLRFMMEQANLLGGPVRIDFASPFTINLTADLPPLTNQWGVTINGNNSTIDGSSVSNTTGFRGFFVGVSSDVAGPNLVATPAAAYDISSLTIRNTNARGGNGGRG